MTLMRCASLSFMALALIVILLSFCSGCVSGPSVQNQTVLTTPTVTELRVVPLTGNNTIPESYMLEDAVAAITTNYQNQAGTGAQNFSICYIKGTNVDVSGKAQHWLFGIREGNLTTMRVYDHHGISRMTWKQWLPDQEIDTKTILPPEKIIGIAYPGNQIVTNLELEVSNGEYTVTAPLGEKPREFTINATSGVLIATHD